MCKAAMPEYPGVTLNQYNGSNAPYVAKVWWREGRCQAFFNVREDFFFRKPEKILDK